MNEHKISFIICSNEKNYLQECKHYIRELTVPDGFITEVIPITGALSMTTGYQQAMCSTDAKYKIYLHQDVFILNRNFIPDTLKIFKSNDKIGMIGMVGTKQLPDNGCMWTTPMRSGALRSSLLTTTDSYFDLPISASREYTPVQAVDGLLIMTQYDLPWREDLNLGWDFYDVSQSLEFAGQGLRIVVPYQETPWVLHDNGFLHLWGYHQSRENFLSAYFPERSGEIADCRQKAQKSLRRKEFLDRAWEIQSKALSLLKQKDYPAATDLLKKHMKEYNENETYCILCIIANILTQEQTGGSGQDILDSLLKSSEQTNDPEDMMSAILAAYHQIRFCLWRLKYLHSDTVKNEARQILQNYNLSKTALNYFQELTGCTDISICAGT